MATITTSIGTRSASNVDITAVSGAGPYTVTVDSVPSSTKVGDTLNDEAATPNSYLITGISGTDLTVTDSFGAGAAPDDSNTSQATTERTYSGSTTAIGSWEADLDDTDLYSNGDDAQGESYNDGGTAFDESVTIDGGGTVGLNSVTLTVPESERHDGTAGTGARVAFTGSYSNGVIFFNFIIDSECSWIEVDGSSASGGGGDAGGIKTTRTTSDTTTTVFHHNLVHNFSNAHRPYALRTENQENGIAHNNIGYAIESAHSDRNGHGIRMQSSPASGTMDVYQNTMHDITVTGTGTAFGFLVSDAGDVQNNLGTDAATCFSISGATTESHNASSDATASGTGSLTNITTADQYVSTSPVDLHLKSGADAIDAGTDLGTTPSGVNIDIDGRDRDAEGDTRDIGADELVSTTAQVVPKGSLALLGVGI